MKTPKAQVAELDDLEDELITAFRKARKALRKKTALKSSHVLYVEVRRARSVTGAYEDISIQFLTPGEGWGTSVFVGDKPKRVRSKSRK